MSQGHVLSTYTNHITTITFYHPAQNSLPGYLLAELADKISVAGADPDTILIVLKSEGEKTFCAGASFTELASIEDFPTGKKFFMGFAGVINAIRKCPKIVIGRVHGKAVGGGVGLAAACDYCMASKYASVRLSELAVGIGPFVIGPAVERKVGLSAFSQMALNATEWQTADWAKQKGLFTESFESVQQLDAYIEHFTADLIKKSPEALMMLKKVFWEGTDHWDELLEKRAEMSGQLILSDFAKNAISSFLSA
ncbi:MAG: enoyl-CoA hydratase/isomerase family protein [Saprospiraceae bacterium]|jgi:methylglutaconyl-CoA hydratase|nr:enoyl-CoA hydratase/isomerase family protein [Saprospiraceae bacterium]MBK6664658.1 enoyl-CoA hydratase/isomerase family protein [Saprospiraceae bacterium]MBK7698713.1 enoyl-CoA hydratase/isomerase family protein [Saprospiraceae bacterium]MBK9580575.1 enoyl-CoA hydratase/isomerase family protein [Saprospiraceae bacterium]MBP6538876.1 enoyl-CoA hydratase/isomerase family protein [Saprospiraceae bacterium]